MGQNERVEMMVYTRSTTPTGPTRTARFIVAMFMLQAMVFVGPGFAQQEMSAADWINAMSRSMQEQSFSGTFVYIRSGKIETMQIAHSQSEEGVHQRLITLNGSRREVIRTPHKTICYLPDKQRAVLQSAAPRRDLLLGLPENIQSLAHIYHFELGGVERIADRDTQLVSMLPKDEHRYGRQFWVDVSSHLPLKYDLVAQDGSMIERMLFTSLVVAKPADQDLLATTDASHFDWVRHEPQKGQSSLEQRNWTVTDLPSGFRLLSHETGRFAHSDSVEHMVFSDGVASVSVYIEDHAKQPSEQHIDGAQFGAMHVFKSLRGETRITVMGEVPKTTVQLIGHNVQSETAQ